MSKISEADTPRIDSYIHMIVLLMSQPCTINFLVESSKINSATVSKWLHRLHDKGLIYMDGIIHPGRKGNGHGTKRWRWQKSLFEEPDNESFIHLDN